MSAMSKCPSKACVCVSITVWQAISILALIITSVLFLKPYIRVARMTYARCRVETTFIPKQYVCDCGRSCKSIYPCFLVHVSLNASDGRLWTVALYSDDYQQRFVEENTADMQQRCSIYVCNKSEDKNRRVVGEFQDRYDQRGLMVDCFYDPHEIKWGAVLSIETPAMRVFHAIFWPALAFIIGSVICLIFCNRCTEATKKAAAEDAQKPCLPAPVTVNKQAKRATSLRSLWM